MTTALLTAERVRRGETSAEAETARALARIHAENGQLNAFLAIDDDGALRAAKEVDAKRSRGESLGPLAGVPIAVKDALCTRELATTAASNVLRGYVPPYDATVVRKLRSADAVIVGKTNLDEFSMGSSTENSAWGPTKNPWALDRTPGGSSGGSAAAVAAGLTPLALGSDTGGSIRQPASFTGTVGLCPTYGRVSRYGLIAFASSLDRVGPFARTVSDAAALFDIIEGPDELDATSRRAPAEPVRQHQGIRGLRIGIPKEYFGEGLQGSVRASIEKALAHLEGEGAVLRECSLPSTELAIASYYVLATAEASSNLTRYDGVRYGARVAGKDLGELYRHTRGAGFGVEVKRRILLGTFVLSSGYYDAYYEKANAARALIRRELYAALEGVDVLCTPTTPTPAFRFGEMQDPLSMYLADIYTLPASLGGLPALTVPSAPCAETHLPIGLQIIGKPFDERTLFEVGSEVERGFPPSLPPGIAEPS
ncbi:MAG: Asp-tRNA(Asn)/Glu-tRNA(Gln) amidotransferase subunit GatA [Polyangiaceae bacterium]